MSVKFQVCTSIDLFTFEKIEEFINLKIFKTKADMIREAIREYLKKHNTDIITGRQSELIEFVNEGDNT